MSDNERDIVRGRDNPFRDAGLSDPDTRLMKADLAAGIIRILRETRAQRRRAAALAGVTEADISRIHNADLDRFTIDRLLRILSRLRDSGTGADLVRAMANLRPPNLDFEYSKLETSKVLCSPPPDHVDEVVGLGSPAGLRDPAR